MVTNYYLGEIKESKECPKCSAVHEFILRTLRRESFHMNRSDKLYVLGFSAIGFVSLGMAIYSILFSDTPGLWGTFFGLIVVGSFFMIGTIVVDSGKDK
jgi:hypothetical protein